MINKRSFVEYNRTNAVAYALKWALGRNPQFYDYSKLGGDCTNFASQVLWAGGSLMNYDQVQGWYYIDANRKSPSWTGVDFLGNFLINNRGRGPVGELVDPKYIQTGDLIQLSFRGGGKFQHSLIVTNLEFPVNPEHIYISTHTADQINTKLTQYSWKEIRYIHIVAATIII